MYRLKVEVVDSDGQVRPATSQETELAFRNTETSPDETYEISTVALFEASDIVSSWADCNSDLDPWAIDEFRFVVVDEDGTPVEDHTVLGQV